MHNRVNWREVVLDLQRYSGLRQTDIAERIGVTQNFVSNLLNQKRHSPGFERGLRLLELWSIATQACMIQLSPAPPIIAERGKRRRARRAR